MKANLARVSLILMAALLPACATTEVTSTDYGQPTPQGNWVLNGQVENVRESRRHQQGDPAAGAVAGAVIGGVLGTALGGRGFGTFMGATEGAMIGASSSQSGTVGRTLEVFVRFEDGSLRTFVYQDYLPFRPGDYVVWTAQGLARR
jgi:outer membrane lipoprotein SlyB